MAEKDARSAESPFRDAVNITTAIMPSGHWRVAAARIEWALCLVELGRYSEAEPVLLEDFRLLEAARGARDSTTERARTALVRCYGAWGRTEEAGKFGRQAP